MINSGVMQKWARNRIKIHDNRLDADLKVTNNN